MLRQEASTLLAIGGRGCTSDAMSSFNKQSVKGHNIGVVLLTHGVKGHNICVVLSAREVKGKTLALYHWRMRSKVTNIGVVSLAHGATSRATVLVSKFLLCYFITSSVLSVSSCHIHFITYL